MAKQIKHDNLIERVELFKHEFELFKQERPFKQAAENQTIATIQTSGTNSNKRTNQTKQSQKKRK